MSCKGRKHAKKNMPKSLGDVTLNDYANATVCKSRTKKSVTNVAKQIQVDNRSWDEKIEEFDEDFDFIEEENEDGTTSIVMKKQHRKKTVTGAVIQERDGVNYPLDIWFLISEYLRPEDIGRFACICRTSFAVVHSAKFWFHLYKKFYRNVPTLPERLQPECMVRLYGLRACVIRALYHVYTPFISRIKTKRILKEQPCNLLKRQCILMWHIKRKGIWLYYFKLKEHSNLFLTRREHSDRKPDLIEMLEDVFANNEEHCRILQVTCPHFVSIPPIMGLTLSSVSYTPSEGFRHHRLQLGYGSSVCYRGKPTGGSGCLVEIILDPVIKLSVLDWWHPLYPHSQTSPLILNQE